MNVALTRSFPSPWAKHLGWNLGCVLAVLLATSCSDRSKGASSGAATSADGGSSGSTGTGGGSAANAASDAGGSSSGGSAVDAGGTGGRGTATGGEGGGSGTGGEGGSGAGGDSSMGGSSSGGGNGGEAGAAGAPGCPPFEVPSDCEAAADGPLPSELRCTGLYGDWEEREYRCDVREYQPAYELWSDGAEKHRFVHLPPETSVDVSDPNNFEFPVGTQFWKEFWLPSDGGVRLGETRLMRKTQLGWIYTAYVWSEDGSSALQNNDGVSNLHGSGHTVPTREQCADCHEGRRDFILGWDFLMLGEGASGVTLADLIENDSLSAQSDAPLPEASDWLALRIPGSDVEKAALGYLHANCGVSCHNRENKAGALITEFFLRLEVDALDSVHETDAVLTGVNRTPGPEAELPAGAPGEYYDLRPLDTERSLVLARMSVRDAAAMPRIGTNLVDSEGVSIVSAWIEAMSEENGYPEAAP